MKKEDSFRVNVILAVFSNMTIALVSGLTTFILPKFLGIEEYGYWQLFVFYGSYSLLLQLGIGDGSNLRYAGLKEADLLSRGIGLQALFTFVFTVITASLIFLLAPLATSDATRNDVLQLTAIYAAVINIRHFFLVQMQSTGNFRMFSRITVADRLLFSCFILLLLMETTSYQLLATAEIISKIITLITALIASRHYMKIDFSIWKSSLLEVLKNAGAGIKLTFAYTASMLILGVARILIDRTFGIVTFATVSLVLNLSSFFMIFVRAVGTVLLPTLRKAPGPRIPELYQAIKFPLTTFTLTLLIFVYPLIALFSYWLPEYETGIQYLGILMPIIAFESRMALLVDPFLKTLRKENLLMAVNLFALLFSAIISAIGAIILENLEVTILGIVISLGVRMILAEFFILKILKIRGKTFETLEIIVICLSIFMNYEIGGLLGMGGVIFLVGCFIAIFYKMIWRNSLIALRAISKK